MAFLSEVVVEQALLDQLRGQAYACNTPIFACESPVMFEKANLFIEFLVDAGLVKRQTASTYLQTLAGLGVLSPRKKGREVYYINDVLFAELVW